MNSVRYICLLLVISFITTGCMEKGCMDFLAKNYCSSCEKDDGNCQYDVDELIGEYYVDLVDSHWGYIHTSATTGYMGWEVSNVFDTLRIEPNASAKDSLIISLLRYGNAAAKVNGDSITIPAQTRRYCDYCSTSSISGEGWFKEDSIFIDYNTSDYPYNPQYPPNHWRVSAKGKKLF